MSLRFGIFVSLLLLLSGLEYVLAYRKRHKKRLERWPAHVSMIALSSILSQVLFPMSLLHLADEMTVLNIGLMNLIQMPLITHIIISVFLLDFAIYWQHRLFHSIPLFWRLHRVHHSDPDLDATSALRFHPLEMLLSFVYKAVWIIIFGMPATAVLLFEIVLNAMAMFNHANIKLPHNLEKVLRFFVVTPQMHIIHHSIETRESNHNFGFNLSVWDRLFKSYQNKFASSGIIGDKQFLNHNTRLVDLVKQPFLKGH